jgi:hypothetical protein
MIDALFQVSCIPFLSILSRGYASNFQALWNCVPSVNCSFMPRKASPSR